MENTLQENTLQETKEESERRNEMELTYEQENFISDHHRYEELFDEVYAEKLEEDANLEWLDDFYEEVK